MQNNDILRSLRYTFDFNDKKMIGVFGLGGLEVTRAQVSDWLKKEDQEGYKSIYDVQLAAFLNGFIITKRGAKDGETPVAEKKLNNNIVLRKLKIALAMKDDDMLDMLSLAEFEISKHELSAFFRKPSQNQYRTCKDQIVRKFLFGVKRRFRPE